MKFRRKVLASLLALTFIGSTGLGVFTQVACSPTDGKTDIVDTETVYYKITLNLNGGELPEGQYIRRFEANKKLVLPTPTKYGYIFAGWFDNAECEGNAYAQIDSSSATSDKEFWAKWERETALSYSVKLELEGGKLNSEENITSYTAGTVVTLPIPERSGYKFVGWYDNKNYEGDPVTKISADDTGNKTFYAKWSPISGNDDTVVQYTVTFNFNYEGAVAPDTVKVDAGKTISKYSPELQRDNYKFDGWYTSADGNDEYDFSTPVTGDLVLYAHWTYLGASQPSSQLDVTSFGGYEEGAYIELTQLYNTMASDYTVSYKSSSSGVNAYRKIDSELVRIDNGTVRADIVGLSAGSYDIKVATRDSAVEKTVTVTSYDRSGYAHFKYSNGAGGYNDDGTPKSGAEIVYVTEATKNTVKLGSYTGIVEILANSSKLGKPLIVRVIGTIAAATWQELDYNKSSIEPSDVVGINGTQLATRDWTQKELISEGYNKLQTNYTELKNLTSKIKYDSSKTEFDSYWNMCDIVDAENVTVEGIGTDARIFQWGFTWKKSNSIEVRNLTFEDYTEDACSFEGGSDQNSASEFDSKNIWVHHNTFLEGINYWDVCSEQDKHEGDGATDFKRNSYVTISYNHYIENHKTGLIGGDDKQMTASVTFHHNWYERCNSRLPLARQANMHMYNNLYDGSTGTNMSLRSNAYALIENCYFRNANNPITTDGSGVAKVVNCTFSGCSIGSTYTKNGTVVETSRTATVDNSNVFGKNFDTDPNLFYYDSANEKSSVSPKHGRDDVLDVVPELSGVHKN